LPRRYHARWLLPVATTAIRDGVVVVDGAKISWVGPRAEAPPGDDVDLGDAVLLPGLVNAHVHLELGAFHGLLDGVDFFHWVRGLVELRAMFTPDELLAAAYAAACDQMLHGVTTIADTAPGPAAFDALRLSGARGIAYFETFGPDPAHVKQSMAALRRTLAEHRTLESARVRVGVSPHAPYSVSDELYRAVAELSRTENLPIAVHIAESADEHRLVAQGAGAFADFLRLRDIPVEPRATSSVRLLERTGILRERPLCIHAVRADAADALLLKDHDAAIAHCPRANRWFRHGPAPLSAFRHHRLRVGLGTDSAAGNYGVRVLAEANAATDPTLTAAERIAMATAGGSSALGFGDTVGTLSVGLQADLAAFRVLDVCAADADPVRYVLDQCATARALLTVVGGVELVRDGRLPSADDALLRSAERVRTMAVARATR
jgi:cytosine/adenosine deaminase-related metal-dependent hydrolase